MADTIRVVVVDDHEMVRRGLISYLLTEPNIEVVGEASSGNKGVKVVKETKPDVVLMDLLMEDGNGIDATKDIMSFLPECKIIIITRYYDDEQVFPAIEAGAFSYLLKTARADEVITAIQKAVQGETVIEPKVANKMLNRLRPKEKMPHDDLTEREMEVLLCIAEGMTNQEISQELFIGIKTVKTHVSNILSKLNVQDRTQAAIYANRHGLVKSEMKKMIKLWWLWSLRKTSATELLNYFSSSSSLIPIVYSRIYDCPAYIFAGLSSILFSPPKDWLLLSVILEIS